MALVAPSGGRTLVGVRSPWRLRPWTETHVGSASLLARPEAARVSGVRLPEPRSKPSAQSLAGPPSRLARAGAPLPSPGAWAGLVPGGKASVRWCPEDALLTRFGQQSSLPAPSPSLLQLLDLGLPATEKRGQGAPPRCTGHTEAGVTEGRPALACSWGPSTWTKCPPGVPRPSAVSLWLLMPALGMGAPTTQPSPSGEPWPPLKKPEELCLVLARPGPGWHAGQAWPAEGLERAPG